MPPSAATTRSTNPIAAKLFGFPPSSRTDAHCRGGIGEYPAFVFRDRAVRYSVWFAAVLLPATAGPASPKAMALTTRAHVRRIPYPTGYRGPSSRGQPRIGLGGRHPTLSGPTRVVAEVGEAADISSGELPDTMMASCAGAGTNSRRRYLGVANTHPRAS